MALHLITALGKQREISGEKTYFIHVSTRALISSPHLLTAS
jgi:hypothetical protein